MFGDITINKFVELNSQQTIVNLAKFISLITEPIFLFILSLIFSVFLYSKKEKLKSYYVTITTFFTVIVILTLKNLFLRARPINALVKETSSSMPSGHVTFAIIFFGLIIYFSKNKKITSYFGISSILLISLSRIYLRVHWFTDILVASIIGCSILIISILIYKTLKK